ncbi:unnamed protein product [Ascophyllum nodosum]
MPIIGSPFALTITGEPAIDIDALPTCSSEDVRAAETFWKPGTWVSANIASAKHGVTRDGWVFQPKTCVHDTFSYEDLMLLASLNEPTWLLVLGSSIHRGVFLTLVDMVLAQGQKDDMGTSTMAKCWGYEDITVGNLRITYQASCHHFCKRFNHKDDAVQCNNNKLVSGSTSAFLRSARDFLALTVFADGKAWPSVIFTPSFLEFNDKSPTISTEVLLDALPETWQGNMLMLSHMSGFGVNWHFDNPTRTAFSDTGITFNSKRSSYGFGLAQIEDYSQRHPRVKFMSPFPMYQAKLFENQGTKNGIRRYGLSQHHHYVASPSDIETFSGAKMVHSAMTEMLSHIAVAFAVRTKADLYEKVAATPDIGHQSAAVRRSFEICSDCPAHLLPFHVKPVPEPMCETVSSLPGHAPAGRVWNEELCPDWCMAAEPVKQLSTESGVVDVRVCKVGD